jgi:c-di-GMP-binding flagellar brake protein YcgR
MPSSSTEKREHQRYSYTKGAAAPFVTIHVSNSATPIHGEVRDLSEGGVGIRAERGIDENQVIRCELSFPGVPIQIPVLMRVRWSRKVNDTYLMGLQFLI